MRIVVRCGQKSYDVEIEGDCYEGGSGAIRTLGELRRSIAEENHLDPANLKMIRGKTITGSDDTLLSSLNFKEGDKILVMGRPMKSDRGFSLLVDYEKKNLEGLQKTFDTIETDLKALEQNFLSGETREEAIKKMDKRIKMFGEVGLRHLVAIDGLPINNETTPEQQATRNREKRKALVNGIQHLMNLNDKYTFRLNEYQKAIEEEENE